MTLEEYNQKIKELKEETILKESKINMEYAFSNNPYKVDDIIEDHIGKIKVEKIKYTSGSNMFNSFPECVYYGTVLKKDGTPTKKQEIRQVWQSNLKK